LSVEPPPRRGTVLALDGDTDADRTPAAPDQLAIEVGQVGAAVVEHGQAHDAEHQTDRSLTFDLDQPARREPGERADRIDEELDGGDHGDHRTETPGPVK